MQTISFATTGLKSSEKHAKIDRDNIVYDDNTELFKTVGIYGANASGKSNVIKALDYFMSVISSQPSAQSNLGSLCQPFLYDLNVEGRESFFQMIFIVNGIKYRYGFNGKENDNEVKQDASGNNNVGAQQDYGMRIYDPRIGRFLSVDPLSAKYPELTPYQFASNSPIASVDLDGLESVIYSITRTNEGGTEIKKVDVKHLDKPGPLGSGAAVILNKDGVVSYLYGNISKDMENFVVHYEGKKDIVYPSLEGGNPTGGIGHKLSNADAKAMPVGTKLSEETISNWFKGDWKTKSEVVEKNSNTKDFTGGQKDALTDAVFNNISISTFKKAEGEKFFFKIP